MNSLVSRAFADNRELGSVELVGRDLDESGVKINFIPDPVLLGTKGLFGIGPNTGGVTGGAYLMSLFFVLLRRPRNLYN